MRSALQDLIPLKLRRALRKLGRDLSLARRKRRLTIEMMAERTGVAKATYSRVEKGDPSVGMGVYAMVVFVLGFGEHLFEITDPRRDEQGLLLEEEYIPKRVRPKKEPTPQSTTPP